jgi:hypothetical protein
LMVKLAIPTAKLHRYAKLVNTIGTLKWKEDKARKIIKSQKSQVLVERQMGENVCIDLKPTGVVKIGGVYWKPPKFDATIPSTQADVVDRVNDLVGAMCNTQGCREKMTKGKFTKRWATGATYYGDMELRAAAYNLVVSKSHIPNSLLLTWILGTHGWCPRKRLDRDYFRQV